MNLRRIIWNARWLNDKQRIEWYPAFWLMRPKVSYLSPCWRRIRIILPHSSIATNTGGSLFGGFQACLADPIAAMACYKLFPGYRIWTQTLELDFKTPGITDLELCFEMTDEKMQQIQQDLETKGRSTPVFDYGYYLSDGRLCTEIKAVIAIRPLGYQTKTLDRVVK